MAAQRAERQRISAKSEMKRTANREQIAVHHAREHDLLSMTAEAPPRPDTTFTSFGTASRDEGGAAPLAANPDA